MALFTSKKKKTEDKAETVHISDMGTVLLRPRITEKASMQQGNNIYVFDVAMNATKPQIKSAFSTHFKVVPIRIRVVNTAGTTTRNMRTGRTGQTSASRKAYIYLKKGDTISIT